MLRSGSVTLTICHNTRLTLQAGVQALIKRSTSISPAQFCICQRSYAICKPSHTCGDDPKALDNRIAISTETPVCSFTRLDNVCRVTSKPSAARVMLKPRGSRHCRLIMPPGCGGLCMIMINSLLVIIQIIYIYSIAVFKPKGCSPVSQYRNCIVVI